MCTIFFWSNIKHNFSHRYEGNSIDINSKLNINGYYQFISEHGIRHNSKTRKADTSYTNIIFYDDGTVVYNFFPLYNEPKSLIEYLKFVREIGGLKDYFYTSFYWGIYKISGDTIKAQFISHKASYMDPLSSHEMGFSVIDKNTIRLEYSQSLNTVTESVYFKSNKQINNIIKFHPADAIPPPYSWLKKEKWVWRNEMDWKKYMKSIGE